MGLTQTELSRKLEKTDKYITQIELCNRRIDILETLEICTALELDFVQLMKSFEEMVYKNKN